MSTIVHHLPNGFVTCWPSGGRRLKAVAAAASLYASATLLAAAPAVARPVAAPVSLETPLVVAQLVCDSSGCGAGSGRAAPGSGYMGKPYYGGRDAEEKRALAERDRLRKERRRHEENTGR